MRLGEEYGSAWFNLSRSVSKESKFSINDFLTILDLVTAHLSGLNEAIEDHSPISGLYSTFSLVSLLEFKRLGKLKEKELTPGSFDKQVLIDLFGGNSIFSYNKKCWVKMNELIYERMERLSQTNESD